MPYVRVTVMHALAGRGSDVDQLNRELADYYREQDGCLQSASLRATDGSGAAGRVSFWESESAADTAASTERSMVLRSRLQQITAPGHQDLSFVSA